jgi:beta-1,4-mannosyltransferase
MRIDRLLHGDETYLQALADAGSFLSDAGYPYRHEGTWDKNQPVILAYSPPARRNPFQALLYREAGRFGVVPLPVIQLESLRELPWPGHMVCHIHWLNGVLRGATGESEADDRITALRHLLTELKQQRRKIVWTIHNFLPHRALLPGKEIEVRKVVIDAADAIHVMTEDTPELLAEMLDLPKEKVFYVPHPSYRGAHPNFVTRETARFQLGVEPGDFVFLLFGSLERYKGVSELISAFDQLVQENLPYPVKLIIAGGTPETDLAHEIEDWVLDREDAVALLGHIPSDDVQCLYHAADISVLPYRQSLNSGVALLSMTYGVPVLAPAIGSFRSLLARMGGFTYDVEDEDGLLQAMRCAMAADLSSRRQDIATGIEALAPETVSIDFFSNLFAKLG